MPCTHLAHLENVDCIVMLTRIEIRALFKTNARFSVLLLLFEPPEDV